MANCLILTYRMAHGYGVDVVVCQMAHSLKQHGVNVAIGCIAADATYPFSALYALPQDFEKFVLLVKAAKPDVVVAHTDPFLSWLPSFKERFPDIRFVAWEHGDPPPEYFVDAEARAKAVQYKFEHVYPNVDVVAISDFIKKDIRWSNVTVIRNGGDYLPDLGKKSSDHFNPIISGKRKLRLGTLLRLGSAEARYKGPHLFLDLVKKLKDLNLPFEAIVMGKGTTEDARPFKEAGIQVHLNADEKQKIEFLRSLDIYFSPSQWEGFNLGLTEAESLGTLGMAFDLAAHSEVTPFLAKNLDEAVLAIKDYIIHPKKLAEASHQSYDFVRQKLKCSEFGEKASNYLSQGLKTSRLTPGYSLMVRLKLKLLKNFFA